jgi:OFA family oxalate/formate antiporter-like MFS transporter
LHAAASASGDKRGHASWPTGSILFGIGTILAGVAASSGSLVMLYLTFGVIAGLGNGFGYVTPIATLIRWFPDKRGLVTGLAVMGFGAFFVGLSPDDPRHGRAEGLLDLGAVFLVLCGGRECSAIPSWLAAGGPHGQGRDRVRAASFTLPSRFVRRSGGCCGACSAEHLGRQPHSQLSPMAQEVLKKTMTDPAQLAKAGGLVLAIASIFNGLGRLFWAWLSDGIGRRNVFITMFITQAVLYVGAQWRGRALHDHRLLPPRLLRRRSHHAGVHRRSFGPKNIGRVCTMLTA